MAAAGEVGAAAAVAAYAQFVPHRLLRRHAQDAAPPDAAQAETLDGAVLMADLIGYTALTARYAQRAEGVEELQALLNAFFDRLNTMIRGYGGDIVAFAGDSVLAVWDGGAPATQLAAQCALAAQQALDAVAGELRMRCVVAAGSFTLATVGGTGGKWEYLAAGAPLARIGNGLAQAQAGAVVLDPAAVARLFERAELAALEEGYARVLRIRVPTPLPAREAALAPAPSALRAYIARPVLEQLDAGHADWLAEFRRVSTLFLRVSGIDYAGAEALERLHAATRAVQMAVERFEGSFQRLLCDDKGTGMLCVWGIPGRAHEDDAARALAAARAAAASLQALGLRCGSGIATGRALCGPSGGGGRCEYTVTGDAVNLAARLMVAAGDELLCDGETALAAREAFTCEALAPMQVKGRTEALPVFRPREAATPAPARTAGRVLGRVAEQAQLAAQLDALAAGTGAVVLIEGEPGVGKSRLVAALARAAEARGIGCIEGQADAIERGTVYYAWRAILRALLAAAGATDVETQRERLVALCAGEATLAGWLPLVEDVLPLGFAPDAALARMGEEARAEATRELLLHVLHRLIGGRPLVIVLEDAHWLDSLSWGLAVRLRRQEPTLLLTLTLRSGHAPEGDAARALLAQAALRLALAAFARADTAALVAERLGARELDAATLELIHARSEGHPLFSEELAFALRDAGLLTVVEGVARLAEGAETAVRSLPATVEGVIGARVDRLGAGEQLTLKVASVLGRRFGAQALADIHPLRANTRSSTSSRRK